MVPDTQYTFRCMQYYKKVAVCYFILNHVAQRDLNSIVNFVNGTSNSIAGYVKTSPQRFDYNPLEISD